MPNGTINIGTLLERNISSLDEYIRSRTDTLEPKDLADLHRQLNLHIGTLMDWRRDYDEERFREILREEIQKAIKTNG
ncbi:hypothetical protein [Paenibacillus thermotolerans]|uniref:hypothetical protein n=1 Tax=Paenibacillus thermotolerans TaxID=3027807 RepID=UPI002368BA61|nr:MULTISPECIES: hypothetical protein [unclassified Paenibacillus]